MQAPISLVVANSYGLRLDEITMLELDKCRRNIEKVNDIVFGMCVFKEIYVYVRKIKSLKTLNQRIQRIFIF